MLKTLSLTLPFVFVLAACSYDNGDSQRALGDSSSTPAECSTPSASTIDTDRMIDADAGQGAGVFIEYASGGQYHLRTACDTARSNTACHWDIIIDPQAGLLSNVSPENLTATDSLTPYPSPTNPDVLTSYHLVTETTTELEGVTFDAEPGAAVSIDAYLDGTCALPFFFWVGDGALHQGAPSNPLVLTPSAP